MRKRVFNLALVFCVLVSTVISVTAAPVVRQGSGANAAALQAIVDSFRADLGGANNGVGGTFRTGRRELNWDGVPDAFSEPNNFPIDFFNVNSPRGVIFNAIENETGAALNQFSVSSNTASGVPVRFSNINPGYSAIFQTFSAQRLFMARNTTIMEVNFVVPGTNIPATVSGFGVVFADVDSATGGNRSLIRLYGPDGRQLPGAASSPVQDGGLSFVGVSYNAGERVARVVIEFGNAALSASNNDGVGGVDVVAMDDFIYGEPRASQWHAGDFDGDGFADPNVFRPSTGTWFTLNTGSNTVSIVPWGQNGDIPVDGDFDGDTLADHAIFRPSDGTWWINRSSGTSGALQFGAAGDTPVAADYDKDGKTDIAFWRPANGNYFVLRSSNLSFFSFPWGQTGDIPSMGAAQ